MFVNFLRSKLEKSICSMSPFFVKKTNKQTNSNKYGKKKVWGGKDTKY